MGASMTVKEFQKRLREELDATAAENRWNLNDAVQRGLTFQLWVARTITNFEATYDTEPEESLLRSKDLGADLVLEDSASKHLLVCQCKYLSPGTDIQESQVNDFFHRHAHFKDKTWVTKHGSKEAQLALRDYADRLQDGYTVSLYFVSSGDASQRIVELARRCSEEYSNLSEPVTCELIDFGRLKEYYIRSLSLEQSLPEVVELELPTGQFFMKSDPYPTIVAVVKGNLLQNLSRRYRQALYAWNIRGYLGNRGINQSISETAKTDPADFFYFNNGVSAICTRLELKGNKVKAQKFQIINGAQTVSCLANAAANPDIEVLLRLTQTQSVSTEKGFNRSIIQFNNSQNAVKLSDFRSNDPIQLFLEKSISELRHRNALPKLHYLRKRAVGKRGFGHGLKLEELAKARYAFLYEPTLVHAVPKALWTLEEDGGVYEKAFGVDGELQVAWSEETLDECLLAVALLFRISAESKELAKASDELKFLPRCKYHALSLFGHLVRRLPNIDCRKLVRNESLFEEFWTPNWQIVRDVLADVYTGAEEEDTTMFAFVRSGERWKGMEKRLSRRLAV